MADLFVDFFLFYSVVAFAVSFLEHLSQVRFFLCVLGIDFTFADLVCFVIFFESSASECFSFGFVVKKCVLENTEVDNGGKKNWIGFLKAGGCAVEGFLVAFAGFGHVFLSCVSE